MAQTLPALPQVLEQSKSLNKEGNFKEARLLLEKEENLMRLPELQSSEAMTYLDLLFQMRQRDSRLAQELDVWMASLQKKFPEDWRVYLKSSYWIRSFGSQGSIVDQKFLRGVWSGRQVSSEERDRVQSLQWSKKALDLFAKSERKETPSDEVTLLDAIKQALLYGKSVWDLQLLTEIETLPDYEERSFGYGRPFRGHGMRDPGYPVDAEGNPIFFAIPETWEKSKSDGERWRWVYAQLDKISEESKFDSEFAFLQEIQGWLDTHTLASDSYWIEFQERLSKETDSKHMEARYALSSLKDTETFVKLASGIKRIELPEEYQFLRRLREISKTDDTEASRRALQVLGTSYENRRQYEAALEIWKEFLAKTSKDDKAGRSFATRKVDFIEKPLGKMDALSDQLADKEAQVELVFRNAKKVNFTARSVNVAGLLKLMREKLAKESRNPREEKYEDRDWWQSAFGQLIHIGRFKAKELDGFLSKEVIRWDHELLPLEGHLDRRVTLKTPLTKAGVYLVEAQLDGGNQSRCIVEIQDTVILTKVMASKNKNDDIARQLGIVTDATSGKPIANAEITAFGIREWWESARKGNQYRFSTQTQSLKSDDQGLFELSNLDSNYRWIYEAKTQDGRFSYVGFSYLNHYHRSSLETAFPKFFAFTDRPIYRPGQTVNIAAWAKLVSYDPKVASNVFADKQVKVSIQNAKNETVLEGNYFTDKDGQISLSMALPKNATLGDYSVDLNLAGQISGSAEFKVEEYKKPEFEVAVTPPTETVVLGESFSFEIGAKYYFGAPVKEGKVTYKVERHTKNQSWVPPRPWDWLYEPGYWWRNSLYSWYRGHDKVAYCLPYWYPPQSDAPELIAEATVSLDAEGKAKVVIDTAFAKAMHGDKDHEYRISAEVTDASRRMVAGSGVIQVNREPLQVYAWLNQGFYHVGEPAQLSLQVRNPQGKFVHGDATVKIMAVQFREGKVVEFEQEVFPVKITTDEPAKLNLQLPKAGLYRVHVEFKDVKGVEAETMVSATVYGQGFDGSGYRLPDLELATDKEEYKVGDTAKILVNTDQEGATLYIFERPRDGVYDNPVVKTLAKGKSSVHELKIQATDQPNVFVEVVTVHRGQVFQQVMNLVVPPVKQIAEVALSTPKSVYEPREKSEIKIKVTDRQNNPVKGRVVVTAYDKALDALAGSSNERDIKSFFWGFIHRHQVNSEQSLESVNRSLPQKGPRWGPIGVFGGAMYSDSRNGFNLANEEGARQRMPVAPESVAAAAPKEKGGFAIVTMEGPTLDRVDSQGSQEFTEPGVIRDNFADSILWNATLECNEQGEAVIPLEFTDDLTTWNLVAWTVGPKAEVGEAKVEVITRKEIFIRPQAPRFFVEKDEVVLSGIVHNDTDEEQEIQVSLELDKHLKLIEGETVQVQFKLASKGERRVDWKVRAFEEGETSVLMKVAAAKGSDAVKKSFPVLVHGVEKQLAWSQSIHQNENKVKIEFEVPEERRPAQTTLTLQYSPSLALAMVESLPYLIEYPYGCMEQTLNRFVPTVQVQQVLKQLKLNLEDIAKHRANLNAQALGQGRLVDPESQKDPVFDASKLADMVMEGVEKLEQGQNSDGSWSWWPGSSYSDPYITAQIVEGLHRAKLSGSKINEDSLQRGTEWLAKHATEELRKLNLPEKHEDRKREPDSLDAMIHHVLLKLDPSQAAQGMRDRLYQNRLHLSNMAQARLGLSLGLAKENDRRDMVIRNLSQYLKVDNTNQTAWLDIDSRGYWWRWYYDEIETMAIYLQLLVQKNPKDEIAPQLVKYLLNHRTGGAKWKSTRDTSAVIAAFVDYINAVDEGDPDMFVEVVLDGKVISEAPLNAKNLFTGSHKVVLSGEKVTTGKHELVVRRKGKGSLYVNAYLNYFSLEDPITKAGAEVAVERRLYRLIPKDKTGTVSGSQGQVVQQREQSMDRVLLKNDERIKSGEQVEVELIVTSKNEYEYLMLEDMKAAGFEALETNSGWVYEGSLSAYREFRDTKVNHYLTHLPKGTFTLRYRLRAEVPGRFSALPTVIAGMYSPELKGNSDEQKVKIAD